MGVVLGTRCVCALPGQQKPASEHACCAMQAAAKPGGKPKSSVGLPFHLEFDPMSSARNTPLAEGPLPDAARCGRTPPDILICPVVASSAGLLSSSTMLPLLIPVRHCHE
jgi:hypothetical protein